MTGRALMAVAVVGAIVALLTLGGRADLSLNWANLRIDVSPLTAVILMLLVVGLVFTVGAGLWQAVRGVKRPPSRSEDARQ
jgi:uncharacterized membrane-anchored protein